MLVLFNRCTNWTHLFKTNWCSFRQLHHAPPPSPLISVVRKPKRRSQWRLPSSGIILSDLHRGRIKNKSDGNNTLRKHPFIRSGSCVSVCIVPGHNGRLFTGANLREQGDPRGSATGPVLFYAVIRYNNTALFVPTSHWFLLC